MISREGNLETPEAVDAELQAIEAELASDKDAEQTLQTEVNPEKPTARPLSRSTVQSLNDAAEEGKKKRHLRCVEGPSRGMRSA